MFIKYTALYYCVHAALTQSKHCVGLFTNDNLAEKFQVSANMHILQNTFKLSNRLYFHSNQFK